METRHLLMTFINAEGKKVSLRVNNVRSDIQATEVAAAMDEIVSGNLFITSGGNIASKEAAEVVVTDTTELDVK
ncbi:DUF2922 domain-containing protein [Alloiococcus sp. CFN-8]|uniref:DUF2922 domain-containing protein n=1 Tax=Alloiococcus sp. CFN-8 TaxID=3416081 RepID=UPI003CF88EF1